MQFKLIQIAGVLLTVIYAAFIIWLYAVEPRSFAEIPQKATVAAGTYEIDSQKLNEGKQLFRAENYRAARDFFRQADPEQRDAETQFYLAYSFYREGWGRVYSDDALFKQSLEVINRVVAIDPDFRSDDSNLKIKTPIELKAELEKGLEKGIDDFNPLKVLRERK